MTDFDLILPHLPPRLRDAILSPDHSEVCVNADGRVFVERAGSNAMRELTGIEVAQSQLRQAVNAVARKRAGREADEEHPILNARLPDGSRVAVLLPPLCEGIVLTVRRFRLNWFTLHELVENGTLTSAVAAHLARAVERRETILVSGSTGSGKTTLLKALLDLIPGDERVLLIEDTPEIPLRHPNRNRLEARDGFATIRDLLKASLRHRPDRLVVGEVRDGAAYDLLQALNTGHTGSLSTVHASSAVHALNRLARLASLADTGLPFLSIQSEIGDAIQQVVHLERRDGARRVTECLPIAGFDPQRGRYETNSNERSGDPNEELRLRASKD
jgi:pilus assembly protein CpaF